MKILFIILAVVLPLNGGCEGWPAKCRCKDGVICRGANCSMCKCEVCECSSLDKFKDVR